MNQRNSEPDDLPSEGGASSLEVAAWHLQALLAAIGNSDSKIMFLSALNTAGMSALVGVAIASNPSQWLLVAGLAISGLSVAIGLGRLWAADVWQFPTPDDALEFARHAGIDRDALIWRHFFAVQEAVDHADASLQRNTQVMRVLLLATPISLSLVIATAMTAIR